MDLGGRTGGEGLDRRAAADGRSLTIAVVGCGAVVERLYRGALRRLESRGLARVVGFADPNTPRAAALLKGFRSARVYAAPAELLRECRPTLTLVASPAAFHAEHALAAFERGSHVLCEKPLATRVDEAEAMVEAARRAGRVLAVGMTRRFYPCFAEARRLVSTGELGSDLRFVYREGDVFGWPSSSAAAFRRQTGGGGVLMDVGSHVLDSLTWLFGRPEVRAYEDDALHGGVEVNCRLRLQFPGAAGLVQLSWNQPLASGLHVVGSAGELRIDAADMHRVRWRRGTGAWQTLVSGQTWPGDLRPFARRRGAPRTYRDCISYQLVQVLRALVYGEAVPVDGAGALEVIRTLEACYARATPLPMAWLPAAEQEAAAAMHWSRAA